ncbi:hypothetical protein FRC05_004361 [Tulasnella sp. 425]|nr:hypothetical protein FRC05_004361 [Tulasnella sp. 425]
MRDQYNKEMLPIFNIENIDEHKWRRFLALSRKISRIEIDCGLSRASLGNIEFAKQTFNGEPFSQLQTVTLKIWYGYGDCSASGLAIVTVPSLTSVYFWYEDRGPRDVPSLAWVNKNLPAAAPNITQFGFRGWSYTELDLSRYSALKYIEVRAKYVRPHFWEALASCRLLTKVLLKDCRDIAEWIEEWRADYVQFPALCTFKIRGGNPRTTLKLMLRSRMPMLERLVWDSWTGSGGQHAKNLMVPHLKTYSPRLNVDVLYASSNVDDDGFTDSDEVCW